mmetsp:Transcript_23876/g.36282  ORF Transcript_23876/g.36282 Transcript_23876/m.36282 type:complete len:200 (-) Transcript_23876:1048-1647(-)
MHFIDASTRQLTSYGLSSDKAFHLATQLGAAHFTKCHKRARAGVSASLQPSDRPKLASIIWYGVCQTQDVMKEFAVLVSRITPASLEFIFDTWWRLVNRKHPPLSKLDSSSSRTKLSPARQQRRAQTKQQRQRQIKLIRPPKTLRNLINAFAKTQFRNWKTQLSNCKPIAPTPWNAWRSSNDWLGVRTCSCPRHHLCQT